jgi:5-methylcytosine-specific restriction endonuclease McrA
VVSVPILLLDAAWRIDRVIGVETACELLVCGRAVGASEDIATVMHSPSIAVEVPSVIARIGRVGRNRYRPPSCNARRVRLRDEHVCQFIVNGLACDRRGDSVDHLLPRSRGGESTWVNLVASCRRHNGEKSDRSLAEMEFHGWGLRRAPCVPTREAILLAGFPRHAPVWLPYLAA